MLIGCALLCGATLQAAWHDFVVQAPRGGLRHDESISLQAITGHQEDLERLVPGQIVPMASVHAMDVLDDDRGPARVARGLARTDFHPPLYFLLGHGWLRLGDRLGVPTRDHSDVLAVDLWLARLSGGLIFAALALLCAEGLRRRDRIGVACVAAAPLFLASQQIERESGNCRPYALLILLTVAAWLLLLRRLAPRAGGPASTGDGPGIALGVVLGLGLLTHYLFAFVAAPVVLAGLQGRGGLRRAAITTATATTVFAPWLLYQGTRAFLAPGHLRKAATGWGMSIKRIDALLRRYFSGSPQLESLAGTAAEHGFEVAPWMLPGALAITCAILLVRRGPVGRALGLALLLPLALPLAVDLAVGKSLLDTDRVAVGLVPLTLWGIAWALSRVGRRVGPVVALVVAGAVLLASPPRQAYTQSRGLAGGARLERVLQRVDSARVLVVTNADARGQLLQRVRYLPGETDLVLVPPDRLARDVPKLAAGYSHLHVLTVRHPRGHPTLRRKHATRMDKRLVKAGFQQVTGQDWQRGGWVLYRRKGRTKKTGAGQGR